MMGQAFPKTPCVGICSTVFGDVVCRGCKRFSHEIIDWNTYSSKTKQAILTRLERQLIDVVAPRIEIVDAGLLEHQLQKYKVRYNPGQHPLCWAYDLLSAGAERIRQLDKYGLALREGWHECNLVQLRNELQDQFYTVAEKAYRRQHDSA